jgi:hypothetical protein
MLGAMDIEDLEVAACPGIDLSARLLAELSVTQAHMDVASAWLAAADGRFRQRRTTRELNRLRRTATVLERLLDGIATQPSSEQDLDDETFVPPSNRCA